MRNKRLLQNARSCFIWIIVFFAVQLMVSVPFALTYGENVREKQIPISVASAVVFLLLIIFSFAVKKKHPFKELDCNKFSLKAGIFPLSAALFFSLGYNVCVNALASQALLQNIKKQTEYIYASGILMAVLCAVILQPLMEEVLFRAIIMKRLTLAIAPGPAIFISAVIFGLAHIMAGGYLFPMSLLGGLIFAYAYYKSGSLIPAVLAHMEANIGGLVVDFWDYSAINPFLISIAAFILCGILLFYFSRIFQEYKNK